MRFSDIPRAPRSSFRYDNSVRHHRIVSPVFLDTASGHLVVMKPWKIIGWTDQLDANLMHGREGQIAFLLENHDGETVWQHYPLFEDERNPSTIIESRNWP